MSSPSLSIQRVTEQPMPQVSYSVQKQLVEALIFITREKIIDNIVREIFNAIFDIHSPCVKSKDVGFKLKEKYQRLQLIGKPFPLTPREEQFRTYMTEQVMSVLKASTPSLFLYQKRRKILDAMHPYDRSMIEFLATRSACELLAKLDQGNSQIVDDLLRIK